jgi:hypothetical protein
VISPKPPELGRPYFLDHADDQHPTDMARRRRNQPIVFLNGNGPFPGVSNFIENAILVCIKEHIAILFLQFYRL